MTVRRLALVFILLLAVAFPVAADYLVVQRSATIKDEPHGNADILLRPEIGSTWILNSDTQTNGYYEVRIPGSTQPGWIYRTLVRRYPGEPVPEETETTTTLFSPPCHLPAGLRDIAVVHEIDNVCGLEGDADTDGQRAQHLAKNNFCASRPAIRVTRRTFNRLQRAADDSGVRYGWQNLPADRSSLQDIVSLSDGTTIGEGSLVRYVGYVIEAHHSNVSRGEKVNCRLSRQAFNDIHVSLSDNLNDDACRHITAEISPHFRPFAWDQLAREELGRRPVRITGPLFFDSMHRPCSGGVVRVPPRATSWEIHPVHAIDVCINTSMGSCRADDESKWVSLAEWFGPQEEE